MLDCFLIWFPKENLPNCVPQLLSWTTCLILYVSPCPTFSRATRVSCFTCSRATRLSCPTCCRASFSLCITCSRSSRASCLTCSRALLVSYPRWSRVPRTSLTSGTSFPTYSYVSHVL